MKATLSKVELGEADAAIVYVSDAKSSDKVDAVQIPDAVNVITTLPIVVLKDAKNAPVAKAWSDFLVVRGESELVDTYGFLPAMTRPRRRREVGSRAPTSVIVVGIAGLTIFFGSCRSLDCWGAVEPGRFRSRRRTRPGRRCACRWCVRCRRRVCRCCSACPSRGCWLATEFRGRNFVRVLKVLPLVLPPVVGGVALLMRSAAVGSSANGSTTPSACSCRSPCGPRNPCRDVCRDAVLHHHGGGRAASTPAATKTRPPPTEQVVGRSCGA